MMHISHTFEKVDIGAPKVDIQPKKVDIEQLLKENYPQ